MALNKGITEMNKFNELYEKVTTDFIRNRFGVSYKEFIGDSPCPADDNGISKNGVLYMIKHLKTNSKIYDVTVNEDDIFTTFTLHNKQGVIDYFEALDNAMAM